MRKFLQMGNWGSMRLSRTRPLYHQAGMDTGHGLRSLGWEVHSLLSAGRCFCGGGGKGAGGITKMKEARRRVKREGLKGPEAEGQLGMRSGGLQRREAEVWIQGLSNWGREGRPGRWGLPKSVSGLQQTWIYKVSKGTSVAKGRKETCEELCSLGRAGWHQTSIWRQMGTESDSIHSEGRRKNPDLQGFSHALHAKADYSCKTWLVGSTAGSCRLLPYTMFNSECNDFNDSTGEEFSMIEPRARKLWQSSISFR